MMFEYVSDIIDGHYPPYIFVAVIGAALLMARKRWHREHTIILTAILMHTGLIAAYCIIFSDNCPKRYFIPAIPLLAGWTAYSLRNFQKWLIDRFPNRGRRIFLTLFTIFAVLAVWDALLEVRPSLRPVKQSELKSLYVCADWLKDNAPPQNGSHRAALVPRIQTVVSAAHPVILTREPALSYYAGSSSAPLPLGRKPQSVNEFINYCNKYRISYVVWDEDLAEFFSALTREQLPGHIFRPVFTKFEDAPYQRVILRFKPNSVTEK